MRDVVNGYIFAQAFIYAGLCRELSLIDATNGIRLPTTRLPVSQERPIVPEMFFDETWPATEEEEEEEGKEEEKKSLSAVGQTT